MAGFYRTANALLRQKWTYAITAPDNPHFYVTRADWKKHPVSFSEVVDHIQNFGKEEVFMGKKYQVLLVNDLKFWTMGFSPSETTLINMGYVYKTNTEYDEIAEIYDSSYEDDDSLDENERARVGIDYNKKDTLLDIGCGTGLFYKMLKPNPSKYMGLDLSAGMLKVFKKRHPYARLVLSSFENFYSKNKFDHIISTFGSPSYVTGRELIEGLKFYSHSGTKIYFMFYREGYVPLARLNTKTKTPIYLENIEMLDNEADLFSEKERYFISHWEVLKGVVK